MGSAGPPSLVRLYSVIRVAAYPHTHMRVWLVVGLGVDRIVDASLYCGCSPPGCTRYACAVCGVLLFVLAY